MPTGPKSPKTPRAKAESPTAHAAPTVADALARAAAEAARQHERLHRVMAHGHPELELEGIAAVAEACDAHVRALVAAYAGASPGAFASEDVRRAAGTLYLASHDFVRRYEGCNLAERELKRHSAQKLTELLAEYELQATALLALRQAVVAYRKLRPDQVA